MVKLNLKTAIKEKLGSNSGQPKNYIKIVQCDAAKIEPVIPVETSDEPEAQSAKA